MKNSIKVLAFVLTFVMLALTLVSCAPKSDPDKAKAALEKKEYTVLKTNGYLDGVASALLGKEKTVDATVSATKTVKDKDGNDKTESVVIIYYVSKDAANDAWAEIKKNYEKDNDSDWAVGKSGKMIWYGTKAAIKAAS